MNKLTKQLEASAAACRYRISMLSQLGIVSVIAGNVLQYFSSPQRVYIIFENGEIKFPRIEKRSRDFFEYLGLVYNEHSLSVLVAINREKKTPTELQHQLKIPHASIYRILNELVENQLVVIEDRGKIKYYTSNVKNAYLVFGETPIGEKAILKVRVHLKTGELKAYEIKQI